MGNTWTLTDHICAHCMGRVLASSDQSAPMVFRCSNCGHTGEHAPDSICCCGMSTRELTRGGVVVQKPKLIGLRCVRNIHPTPELPCEIIAVVGE